MNNSSECDDCEQGVPPGMRARILRAMADTIKNPPQELEIDWDKVTTVADLKDIISSVWAKITVTPGCEVPDRIKRFLK